MARRLADCQAPQAHGAAACEPAAPMLEQRQLSRHWAQAQIQEPSGQTVLLEPIQPGPPSLFSRPLVVLDRQEADRSEAITVELPPSDWPSLVAADWIQAALVSVAHPPASGALLLGGPIGLESLEEWLIEATAKLEQAHPPLTSDRSAPHPSPGEPRPASSAPDSSPASSSAARTETSSRLDSSPAKEKPPAENVQLPAADPSPSLLIPTAVPQGSGADTTSEQACQTQAVAFNWALLWLAGTVSLVWLPLLLLDRLPEQPSLADGHSPLDPAGAGLTSRAGSAVQQPPGQPALQAGTTPSKLSSMLERVQPGQPSLFSRPLAVLDREAFAAALTDIQPTGNQRSDRQRPALASALRALAPVSLLEEWSQSALRPATGAMLLGGAMGLEAIHERAMVPAARVEQARLATAADQLQAIPLPWRQHLRALLGSSNVRHPLPAEIVRIPAAHLSQPQEIPLLVQRGGVADTTVPLDNAASRRSVERWLERQPVQTTGEIKPVLIVLEPSGGGSQPPGSRPKEDQSPTPNRQSSTIGWSSVTFSPSKASTDQSGLSPSPDAAGTQNQAAGVTVHEESSHPSQTP